MTGRTNVTTVRDSRSSTTEPKYLLGENSMRFTARALGALAVAGILAVTHPGAAYAVDGNLYLGKKRIEDPSDYRCYPYNQGPVRNSTDGYLAFYSGYGCSGRRVILMYPDSALLRAQARSIRILRYYPRNP